LHPTTGPSLWQEIAEAIADALIVVDTNGVVQYINTAAATFTGWAESQAAGQPVDKVLPLVAGFDKNGTPGAMAFIRKHAGRKEPVPITLPGPHGDEIQASVTTRKIKGTERYLILLRTMEDATICYEVRRVKEQYDQVMDRAKEFIFQLDTQGNFIFFNKYAEEISGYSSKNWQGRSFAPIIHPQDLGLVNSMLQKMLAGFDVDFETRIKTKRGAVLWLRVQCTPIYYQGKITRIFCFAQNITARKHTQEQLRASEQRYRKLFESSKDAVMTLEPPAWCFTSGNPAILKIFKVKSEAEFTALAPWQLSPPSQPDGRPSMEKAREMIEIAMNKGSNFFEWTHRRATGEDFPATVLLTRVELPDWTFLQATVRDITQQKHAETELKYQFALQELIIDISTELIKTPSSNIDVSLNKAIQKIGRLTGVDRCYVFLLGRETMSNTHEWCKQGIEPQIDSLQDLPLAAFPWWMEKLRSQEIIHIHDPVSLPEDAQATRKLLERQDIISLLAVPIISGLELIGFVGFDSVKQSKDWHSDTIGFMKIIGNIFGDALVRKWSEDKLRESEELYRNLYQTSLAGLWRTRRSDGKILKANLTTARLLGFSSIKEFLKSGTISNFYRDPESRRNLLDVLNSHSEVNELECELYRADGAKRDFLISAREYRELDYIEGVITDITERKQAAKALRDSEENLRTTLNSIGDAVIATDSNCRIVRLNPVAQKLIGWHGNVAKGLPLDEVLSIVDMKTQKPINNLMQSVIDQKGAKILRDNVLLYARDGRTFQIKSSCAPIRDQEGNITGMVLVFRDVTEEYRVQEELKKIQKLESIGLLAGGIAHDFNNILTGLFGNIMLAKTKLPAKHQAQQYLEQAQKSMNRAIYLTKQLLTFAQGGEPVKESVTLDDLIRETANFALIGSSVKLNFEPQEGLWPVDADKGQLGQVVTNLVINARQAMPEGGTLSIVAQNTHLEAEGHAILSQGKFVKLTIADEGTGIAKQHLNKIFDPYFTTKNTGSGLGLAIVHSIIKKHKGHIRVASELGAGTTFTIHLPVAEILDTTCREWQPPEENIQAAEDSRVLVMDDDDMVRNVSAGMLRALGYQVVTVSSGQQAIDAYKESLSRSNRFDAVILDLTTPGGIGGKQVSQRLLSLDKNACIVVTSGYSNDPVMAQYQQYGLKGVLEKPFTIHKLQQEMCRVLSQPAPSRRPSSLNDISP